ncbi:MAG TPA: hypothetical protein DHM37_01370 [Candidatus Cloacimonas sp.]|jgi:hypothetical protein|nr:hypothetical protein [Candidatus Cloacimonadota bacterium]HCX72345.1 hypothetical protein [Candidatus Cloacimonas sp.]
MKKFCKKIFKFAIFGTIAYSGFKIFERIKSAIEISKTLPQYLENVVGEKPKVNTNVTWKQAHISVGFPKQVIEKNKDLESTIRDYIEDFYPALPENCVDIKLYSIE